MKTELDKALEEMETLAKPAAAPVNPEGVVMEEYTFTNDRTNPAISHLNAMLYESAFRNKLGIMHARNKETGLVQTLIVGVEVHPEQGIMTWPLAKILTEEEQGMYEAPDGKGNYA